MGLRLYLIEAEWSNRDKKGERVRGRGINPLDLRVRQNKKGSRGERSKTD
jgi:hypothetical protein